MLPPSGSPRTRVARRIEADPTSTALLLAGPAAVELWPGVRRVGELDGRLLVTTEPVPDDVPDPVRTPPGTLVAVSALPPRRTPTAYVTQFSWSPAGLLGPTGRAGSPAAGPAVRGRLTLAYAPTGDGTPVTHAALELDTAPTGGGAAVPDLPTLTAMAERFLDNLARAAELRNRAA